MGLGTPCRNWPMRCCLFTPLLTFRYAIALAFLLLLFGRQVLRGLKACSVRDWLAPSLSIAGAYVAGNIALTLTAATSVAFLRSLSTVMTPLLALVFFRRRMGRSTSLPAAGGGGAVSPLRPGGPVGLWLGGGLLPSVRLAAGRFP